MNEEQTTSELLKRAEETIWRLEKQKAALLNFCREIINANGANEILKEKAREFLKEERAPYIIP